MKKKIFTLDRKSAFDESLTDSGLRLLIRFCLVFGTEHCKNSEKPWLKLKLPRSTYYRHMSDLAELQYLQRNPDDDSFSLSVPLLRRIAVENPGNGTELYTNWDSEPSSEREEKRTKREDKATHTIDTGLRKEKDTEYEDIEYSKPLENQYSVSSDNSNKSNILNAFVEQPNVEQEDEKKARRTREYQEIIGYLNEKTGKRFTAKSRDTQGHISARLDEGFTVDDFKTVIDKKVREWMGTEMEKYLRPETLFSKKFDRYLNETNIIRKTESGWDYRVDVQNDPMFDEIWSAGSGGRSGGNG